MSFFCTTCGAQLPSHRTTRFCGACGNPVKDAAGASAPLAPPARVSPPPPAEGVSPPAPLFIFAYTALTKTKEKKTGSLQAPNRVEAIRILERHGLVPIRIAEPQALPVVPAAGLPVNTKKGPAPSAGAPGPEDAGVRGSSVAEPPLREPLTIPCDEIAEGPGERFEVVRQNKETVTISSAARLREYILKGYFARDAQVRRILVDEAGNRTESPWTTLEKLDDCKPSIELLYRPIWSRTITGLWYGLVGGIIVMLLDKTVFLFDAQPELGIMWIVLIAGLALSYKWSWVKWVGIIIVSGIIKEGNINIFALFPLFGGALFSVVLIGSIFGSLVGMIGGTITGYVKKSSSPRAPDAIPEGNKPLKLGLYAPLAALVILIPVYIWLINKLVDAME